MKRCLRDQTLLLLYEGEGTDLQRAHLKACLACARRYRRLVHELEVIGRVLQEEPPLRSFAYRAQPSYVRWVPLATALGVVLAILWGGMWVRRVNSPVLPEELGSISEFLEEVSTAVFSAVNDKGEEGSSSTFDFTYLREALGEE